MNKRLVAAFITTFMFVMTICIPVMAFASDLPSGDEAASGNDEAYIPEEDVPAGSFPMIGSDNAQIQGGLSRLSENFWLATVVIPFAIGIAGVGVYVGLFKMRDEKSR